MKEEDLLKKIAKSIGWGDGKIRYAVNHNGSHITIILDDPSDMDKALEKMTKNGLKTRCISKREIIFNNQ